MRKFLLDILVAFLTMVFCTSCASGSRVTSVERENELLKMTVALQGQQIRGQGERIKNLESQIDNLNLPALYANLTGEIENVRREIQILKRPQEPRFIPLK